MNATKFCIATFLSNLGDIIYSVVIAWYIADVLQSGFLMGAVLFSLGLSRFIAGLLCGPVIDRIGAKLFLWLSDIIRAIIVLVLAILLWDHTVSFVILIMVSVLFGAIDAFYWSASESIKPRLVATEYLSRLNMFFASKKCRELQEKIHRLAGSMNLPFNRARRERLNGRKRVPQAVALSRKRENVGVMDQTIHQRCRQAVVPKHSIPLSKL